MKKLLLIFIFIVLQKNVFAQCYADFVWYESSNPIISAVFYDTSFSASTIVNRLWDFGDGSFGSGTSVQHTFPNIGNYIVCLTIEDQLGCIDTNCDTIIINLPTEPVTAHLILDSTYSNYCQAPSQTHFSYFSKAIGYFTTDSVSIYINYGDGNDTLFYEYLTVHSHSGIISHSYLNTGFYNPYMIVTGPDQKADTSFTQQLYIAPVCDQITGKLFIDINNNCIFDGIDQPLSNATVQLYNVSLLVGYTTTDINGNYSFNVPNSISYTFTAKVPGNLFHYSVICPSGDFLTAVPPAANQNFPLTCIPSFDFTGHVFASNLRPGNTSQVNISVANRYCTTPPGQIELIFDSLLTPLPDTSGAGYSVNGSIVTLPILSTFQEWNFSVPVFVSTLATTSNQPCVLLNVTPLSGDSFPSDNTMNFCFPIRNSFDPNDKYANPPGMGPQGFIRPETYLHYSIRFQNTGNAEAINVSIRDVLDTDLDVTTFQVLSSSHPVVTKLEPANNVRFNFFNILLPDSNTNEPESHGYVSYRILPQSNITHLDQITNLASIYFDYNSPVITNATFHTIDFFLSIPREQSKLKMTLFPNPIDGECEIVFDEMDFKTIQVYDKLGRIIISKTFNDSRLKLNTSGFDSGVYFIRVFTSKGIGTVKFIVSH